MLVKVAIDLSLDRLFTYEVPEEHRKKLAVGQLLSVPFGPREARGFAMEIISTPIEETGYRIKPIKAIIDETPFFSRELLTVIERIAAYTASPIEAMLRCAVPASVLKRNARPRELLFVEPAFAAGDVKLTKRQRDLYDQIVRLGGGWLAQLMDELKTSAASIKALGERGLVTIAARERRRSPLARIKILPTKPLTLNDAQAAALRAISALERGKTALLQGVTGSGKTEVYLQAIAAELAAERGAIVMVPEIALTPQTVDRFASRFGTRVAVLHSALSDGERYDEWHRIRSGEARVVVGPRSVVFAPVRNLGLIVVDEEHETSYKQDESPRYHARDVAVLRGAVEGAKVVLGSATPSLESHLNCRLGKYERIELKYRAGAGTMPTVRIVDLAETRGAIFSQELLEAIGSRLDRGEQTILFLNRRGYSREMACGSCGHVIECPDCALPYTYHRADRCLRCHICGRWRLPPERCPACGATAFDYVGVGTQRAEAALHKCFPRASIARMDADSTSRKFSHEDILSSFRRGEADILLGTQMIAKGLDFPNVTLVGILNADQSLNLPDFRAAERTFQLIAQVAGRAGRSELAGEVVIQTYDPKSSTIRLAGRGDFAAFAAQELAARKEGYFPPFCHLAVVRFKSKESKLASSWASLYAASFAKWAQRHSGFVVSEALPSVLEKADGFYRYQVVLRAAQVAEIVSAWRWISRERPAERNLQISIDIDARNLL